MKQDVQLGLHQVHDWTERVRVEKLAVDKKASEHSFIEETIKTLKKRNNENVATRLRLQEEGIEKQKEKERKDEELRKTLKDKKQLLKQVQKSDGEAENKVLDEVRKSLKSELSDVASQVEKLKIKSESDQKTITALLNERDLLQKSVVKGNEGCKTQSELVCQRETQVKAMQKEVERWKFA